MVIVKMYVTLYSSLDMHILFVVDMASSSSVVVLESVASIQEVKEANESFIEKKFQDKIEAMK